MNLSKGNTMSRSLTDLFLHPAEIQLQSQMTPPLPIRLQAKPASNWLKTLGLTAQNQTKWRINNAIPDNCVETVSVIVCPWYGKGMTNCTRLVQKQ
jgi:hypothetical protein